MLPLRLIACLLLIPLFASAADSPRIPGPPELGLKAYFLIDFDSGKVLAESAADDRIEPASLTKVLTVYTVADALRQGRIKLTDSTVVSEHAWKQEGSRMFLDVNKPVTVDQLLHGDIIQSGNDASVALAEHVAGTEAAFAEAMNHHAQALGMANSHFMNSTGLPDPEHYTTARDLAILSEALIREFPDIYAYFKQPEFTYNNIRQPNRNGLLGKDPSVDGIKTGHTDSAGYCLIASAKREGMRLISVVLGAKSNSERTRASQALLNYGFHFHETRQLYAANAKVTEAPVWLGTADKLSIGVGKQAVAVTFPRGQFDKMKATLDLPARLEAPIAKGTALGTAHIELDGKSLAEVPLIALDDVPEGSFFSRLYDRARLMMQ